MPATQFSVRPTRKAAVRPPASRELYYNPGNERRRSRAQTTHRDLSGSWVLNLAKSKLGKHTTIGPETIVITCPNSTIQFHTTMDGKESTVIYIPDGKEHIVKQISDSQIFLKAQWKKSVLVTESGGYIVGGPAIGVEPINIKSRWTLSADGPHVNPRNG